MHQKAPATPLFLLPSSDTQSPQVGKTRLMLMGWAGDNRLGHTTIQPTAGNSANYHYCSWPEHHVGHQGDRIDLWICQRQRQRVQQ
jgi:hypothetical protein